jgi:CRISPR-associated exonuclease Cas4
MSELREDEPLLISALNQYLFCPRRCALMHTEGIWVDNAHTAKGTLLHEHADSSGYEHDKGAKVLRGLTLYSTRYGLTGRADIVEVHDVDTGQGSRKDYTPVEYKKGRRRRFENDEVQLCAQALCLEEMFSTEIERGYIFHAASKRRHEVTFDVALRAETVRTIQAVRALLTSKVTPAARLLPRCDGCSLRDVCLPELSDPLLSMAERAAKDIFDPIYERGID